MVKYLVLILFFCDLVSAGDVATYKSGITVSLSGSEGTDYDIEWFYSDVTAFDKCVVYIKKETDITLAHNARNMQWTKTSAYYDIGVNGYDGIAESGDEGIIRYRVDMDWQIDKYFWGRMNIADTGTKYTAYSAPFAFEDLTYQGTATAVVGSTGDSGTAESDRLNGFWYGTDDGYGDEWHTLVYADDDSFRYTQLGGSFDASQWGKNSSDGKCQLFVVDPVTPCIHFTATSTGQFYTTPAKAYWIPKVHTQTTYFTDNVAVTLTNIMSAATLYYRIYPYGAAAGGYTEYTAKDLATSIAGLTNDTMYTMEYYYDSDHKKQRHLKKNPAFPSAAETHGNGFLWHDATEWAQIAARRLTGHYSTFYANYFRKTETTSDRNGRHAWNTYGGGKGYRINSQGAIANAYLALVEGYTYKYGTETDNVMVYSKKMMIESGLDIDPIWFGDPEGSPDPVIEYLFRGYYDAMPVLSTAMAYDIMVANFKSTQVTGGITAIEDYKIRDSLAKWCLESMMQMGNSGDYGNTHNVEGMWGTSRCMVSGVIAVVMPTYNTAYYGTSGWDDTAATFQWTPYKTNYITWKEAFYTEAEPMRTFPNGKCHAFDSDGVGPPIGPLILESTEVYNGITYVQGDFRNLASYTQPGNMGNVYGVFANVMKINKDKTYASLEAAVCRLAAGTLKGMQGQTVQYPLNYFVNEHFGDNGVAASQGTYMASLADADWRSDKESISRNGIWSYILYHDDWADLYEHADPIPPVLGLILKQKVTVGVAFSIACPATDATTPADTLVWSASGLPVGASINSGTGAITGTITNPGIWNVTVAVSDGALTDSQEFKLEASTGAYYWPGFGGQ